MRQLRETRQGRARRRSQVRLCYKVDSFREEWILEDDETVPESRPHDLRVERIRRLLLAWKERSGRDVQVGRNIALRWDEAHPRMGVDPDVYVVEPPPPEGDELTSLRTWEAGHSPPILAVEVVSPSRPDKDYGASPEKYASSGTEELWIFDPMLAGRGERGGPFRLQLWRRDEAEDFSRVYTGEGPVYSEAIGGWVFATDEGRQLSIADDEAGTCWWMTVEEAERAAKEVERAAKEEALRREQVERAAKDEALRRLAELEAKLAGLGPAAQKAGA